MSVAVSRFCACVSYLTVAGLCLAQAGAGKQPEFAVHMDKANSYLHEHRPDLAIPEFEAATAIDPGNVEAQANLGVLLYFEGKPNEAIPHLRIAVGKQPSLAKIQGILGIAELHSLDFTQGQKDLETAFPLIQDPKFKVQVGLELVSFYTERGDLDQAAAVVAELRKAAPDDTEVLYSAYRTYADLSTQSMLRLSIVAPDAAQMHQLLAHEEIKEGNTNAAIAQFRKAIAIDPHLPGVHFELAELLNTSEDPSVKKQAEQEYLAALAIDPQNEKAIYELAEIAAQAGDTSKACQEYTKAVTLRPDDSDAKLGLARILIEMNRKDKAQALLEQTVQLDPTNATAHYRLATLYREQGRIDDAKRQLVLYRDLRQEKDKLRAVYKNLLIQPAEIKADALDDK